MKKYLFSLAVAAFVFSFNCQNLFSQSSNEKEQPEKEIEIPDSVIDFDALNFDENKNNLGINPELQRPVKIISTVKNLNLDPHTSSYSSEAQVLEGLYEGLFSYHPKTLDPVPAIAESYKISRDKKRWTFTIRKDLSFSNGEAINAFTVRKSLVQLLSTPNAPYASLLDCVKNAEEFRNKKVDEKELGISARDNRTLVFSLNAPTAHLAKLLCHHAFSVCLTESGEKAYSGAFTLKEYSEEKLVLVKNEKYWDAKHVSIPEIQLVDSEDLVENTWKFNNGEVDWISRMVDATKLINKSTVRISAIFGTEYIFFNCKNKPWDRSEFRNALMAAVPWSRLRSAYLIPASTFIYPMAGYTGVEGLTETSPEDALEMMKEARKALGYSETEKIKITYGVAMGAERQKAQAEILKEAWAPLGVELSVQTTPDDRYIDSIPGWNADLFIYSWIGDFADPVAFLELFRENSTLNQTKWKNEKFNKLLDEAALTTDNSQHYKLLSQAEQVLIDDGVVMPLSHSLSYHAINLQIFGGWFINVLDIHPFKYLYIKDYKEPAAPNII